MKNTLFTGTLFLVLLTLSSFHYLQQSESDQHEYAALTERRVEAALADGATEDDLLLAEGSLGALGWFVLYGNGEESRKLANEYDKKTFDKYNGTPMIHIRGKNYFYSEILNLGRFESAFPKMVSTEYYDIVFDRMESALGSNAGYAEFKLAEGSLVSLGWMTLYGNGETSMILADDLMNLAYKTFPASDGYYMKQSSDGYAEIINLGRFKLDEVEGNDLGVVEMHEYAVLTEKRLEAALADDGTEDDLLLAEGSLTALGWFVLAGNDEESFKLAQAYDKKTFDKYNGTDMIFIRQKNQCFGEMLNLGRFDSAYPEMISTEYADIVEDRVEAAFEDNAGYAEFKLAEGSLMALGWMTLYGNGAESMALAEQLMNLAYKTFPASDGYYMKQSSDAYFEIINLGRFEMDEPDGEQVIIDRFEDQGDGTVLDNTTLLVWYKKPVDIGEGNWEEATAFVATLKAGMEGAGLSDGSKAGDWRMPTNEEWQTMKDWVQASGASSFQVLNEGRYWSSTTPVNDYGAYHVNILAIGKADFDSRSRELSVWPVRNQ